MLNKILLMFEQWREKVKIKERFEAFSEKRKLLETERSVWRAAGQIHSLILLSFVLLSVTWHQMMSALYWHAVVASTASWKTEGVSEEEKDENSLTDGAKVQKVILEKEWRVKCKIMRQRLKLSGQETSWRMDGSFRALFKDDLQ